MGDRIEYNRQDLRPEHIHEIDPESLNPRAKALIFLPDLVTDYIEAAFSEPITVTCLSQQTRADVSDASLDAAGGDRVVVRQSLIHGAKTERRFIHATVHLVEKRVPELLIADLRDLTTGLGRLLDKHRIHHRREMLWYGVEHSDTSCVDLTSILEGHTFLARCYRLVDEAVPFATIIERFSTDLFGD